MRRPAPARPRRRLAALLPALLAAAVWAQPAAAQEPVRLSGTTLASTSANVTIDCFAPGGPTASFTAAGVSTPPYAGTFSENGSFDGEVPELLVNFEIESPPFSVAGRKGLNLELFPQPLPAATCTPFPVPTLVVVAEYEAIIDSPEGQYVDLGTATLTLVDGGPPALDSVTEEFVSGIEAPFPYEPPFDPPFLLFVDEDSIDNGNAPNFFGARAVNDDIARIGLRTPLPAFDGPNLGRTYVLHTGQVGDEGWFAPRFDDPRWAQAGPTPDAKRNFVGHPRAPYPHGVGPGLGSPDANGDRESRLDKVRDVVPLRATGLEGLEGRRVCAVVWDSDIGLNYGGAITANLKGANLGTVAFRVLSTAPRTNGSSGSLPAATVEVLDAGEVCEEELENYTNAPVPRSSSEPYDTGR